VVVAVDRVARKLLPLSVLLRLTLVFPDKAPSRFALARRAWSVRQLQERVKAAREVGAGDDATTAAENVLLLVAALGAHDRHTRGHSERVRVFTDLLAEALHIPQADRDRLRWAALLHDIGKLEVPAAILNKPGKPDPEEWEALKRHPAEGARLAGPLLPWLGKWGAAIEQHHERFDGAGYPHGVSGPELSMGGRILTVADSFETMTAARSYKKPMSVAAARRELARCSGSQFDPSVVRGFFLVSLGRLWWTVGPLSWLAQLPFIGVGVRDVGLPAATAARAAAGMVARAMFGVAALGMGAGFTAQASPVREAPSRGGPQVVAMAAATGPANDQPATDQDQGKSDSGRDGKGGNGGGSGEGNGSGGSGGDGDGGGGSDGGSGGGGSSGGGDGGGTGLGGTLDDPVGTVGGVVDDAVDTVGDVADGVGDTVGGVVDDVGDAVGGAVDDVKDVADGVGDLLP
jgi:hypothetical protein